MLLLFALARAATLDVPCDVAALIEAFDEANATEEPDTLLLAPGCVYTLTEVAPVGSLGFWMGATGCRS